jgi:uncharacterized iron-regulated membrane protein
MKGQRLRPIVRHIHLCLGLTLGALFALLGLTGSALVFYQEIDAALHPALEVSATGPVPDWQSPVWDRGLSALRAQWPDWQGAWRFEVTGRPGPIPVRYEMPGMGHGAHRVMVWLSPDGGHVLRQEVWGDYAMTWLYRLHMELLSGEIGHELVGWSGLAILVLLLGSGLWAWWPRGSWRKGLRYARVASPLRRLRDLHKLSGLIAFPLLAVLTLTGAMLALPDQSNAALHPLTSPVDQPVRLPPLGDQRHRLSIAAVLAIGHRAMPQANIVWIEVPPPGKSAYMLRLRQPGDPSARFPHSYLYIHPETGTVLGRMDAAQAGATSTINNWLHPLHDASVAGLATRWLAFFIGLVPAFLFATGLLRWRLRLAAQTRAARSHA